MSNILDRIIFSQDGVYFLIDYEKDDPKEDIFYIIDKYNIEDINLLDIDRSIINRKKYIFLTKDKAVLDRNEKMDIIISEDNIKADVIFYPPKDKGKLLTKMEIINKINDINIKFGLDLSFIDEFLQDRDYSKTYTLARGVYPEEGQNGFLEYAIDIEEKKPKPKILEDGSIDYKTLNLFENVRKGTILAIKIDAISGKDGKDIYGNTIYAKQPLEAPDLPMGKNTEISEDGKRLISSINGCVFYRNKLIDVLPVLEIKSDVDNSIGNIDFLGSVIVRGNVLNGFTINATGNVDIYGWVEGATIIAEGDVFIKKGIQGAGKASIVSSGNVTLNFVENATITAEKNINASSIMHGNIYCNGDLTILGKRGIIVGGKTIVGGDLFARDIGSSMSNNTEITVGINHKVLSKYEELVRTVETMTEKYNLLQKIVDKLSKIDINNLSKEKRILLEKSIKEKLELKKKIFKCKSDIQKLVPLFTSNKASLKVSHKLYGGTKIVINNAIVFIKEDIERCILKNIDGKIKIFK